MEDVNSYEMVRALGYAYAVPATKKKKKTKGLFAYHGRTTLAPLPLRLYVLLGINLVDMFQWTCASALGPYFSLVPSSILESCVFGVCPFTNYVGVQNKNPRGYEGII